MLEMPIYDREREIMEYYLCLSCVVRTIVKCKWTQPTSIHPDISWCSKIDEPCRVDSDPKTGYVFCPQIREWQEQQCSWAKAQNREFERKRKEQLKLIPAMLTTPLHPKGRVLSEEEAEEYEEKLKKKKKDRDVGKYKPSRRGKG
jgi:hypothetical protein